MGLRCGPTVLQIQGGLGEFILEEGDTWHCSKIIPSNALWGLKGYSWQFQGTLWAAKNGTQGSALCKANTTLSSLCYRSSPANASFFLCRILKPSGGNFSRQFLVDDPRILSHLGTLLPFTPLTATTLPVTCFLLPQF